MESITIRSDQMDLKISWDLSGLEELARKSPTAFAKALEKAGIQLLTWMNTGSPKQNRTPPIRFGILRGSSSVIVEGKHIFTQPQNIKPGAEESISPATSGETTKGLMQIVYNTHYAAKMHEWDGGWGKFTKQAANAGPKWIELHLASDKEDIMKMIANQFGKETGLQ